MKKSPPATDRFRHESDCERHDSFTTHGANPVRERHELKVRATDLPLDQRGKRHSRWHRSRGWWGDLIITEISRNVYPGLAMHSHMLEQVMRVGVSQRVLMAKDVQTTAGHHPARGRAVLLPHPLQ